MRDGFEILGCECHQTGMLGADSQQCVRGGWEGVGSRSWEVGSDMGPRIPGFVLATFQGL
jgi:hypothetical protein